MVYISDIYTRRSLSLTKTCRASIKNLWFHSIVCQMSKTKIIPRLQHQSGIMRLFFCRMKCISRTHSFELFRIVMQEIAGVESHGLLTVYSRVSLVSIEYLWSWRVYLTVISRKTHGGMFDIFPPLNVKNGSNLTSQRSQGFQTGLLSSPVS